MDVRKTVLLAGAGTLFLAGAVRVELVAKAGEATKESLQGKIRGSIKWA